MKKQLFILICIVMMFSAKAQTAGDDQTSRKNEMGGKIARHNFPLAYENESGGGPRNGFSIGYMVSPGTKRKYYIGITTSILSGVKKESYLEYNLGAFTFSLTQRVFLGQRTTKLSPFLDFDLGYRLVKNSAKVPESWGSKAPGIPGVFGFRYYTGGETTDLKSMSSATGYIGAGCFLNITNGAGIFVKMGYRITNQFELIDRESTGTTTNHTTPDHQLGYNTFFTKSSFFTFSLGLMLGK